MYIVACQLFCGPPRSLFKKVHSRTKSTNSVPKGDELPARQAAFNEYSFIYCRVCTAPIMNLLEANIHVCCIWHQTMLTITLEHRNMRTMFAANRYSNSIFPLQRIASHIRLKSRMWCKCHDRAQRRWCQERREQLE